MPTGVTRKSDRPTSALIVEGGAMRGIFSSGVLDEFIQQDFYPFDLYFGISAGSSNVAGYLGGKYGRSYRVITEYCLRPEFKSLRRFFTGGNLIDIDWLWDITEQDLDIGKDRIDQFKGRFFIVATDAATAEAEYIVPEKDELFQAMKCSSAMPVVYRNRVMFRGREWLDGGVADSLPVKEAYRRGARQILVVRSNVSSYRKQAYRIRRLFPIIMKRYPAAAKRLQQRHTEYNETLDFIRNPPPDCEIVEICPPDGFLADQFTMDASILHDAYQMGVEAGRGYIHMFNRRDLGTKVEEPQMSA